MLIRTIYVSRATSALPLDLKDILAASQRNNPVLGISGAMCFLDGVYLQYIEGEAATVDALYKKIQKDPRHKEAKLLDHEFISQREYPKWSMALLTWTEETKAIFSLYNPDAPLDLYTVNPSNIAELLHSWANTRNWMTV